MTAANNAEHRSKHRRVQPHNWPPPRQSSSSTNTTADQRGNTHFYLTNDLKLITLEKGCAVHSAVVSTLTLRLESRLSAFCVEFGACVSFLCFPPTVQKNTLHRLCGGDHNIFMLFDFAFTWFLMHAWRIKKIYYRLKSQFATINTKQTKDFKVQMLAVKKSRWGY